MKEWERDKKISDKYLPEIKRILGEVLISEPPMEEDAERNTDLIVLRLEAIRIACRVRDNDYLRRYGHEFTIRSGRPSGVKTELTKIIEGWGDYFFYGFSNNTRNSLAAWKLIHLNSFRVWFNRELIKNNGSMPGELNTNRDGTQFVAFDTRLLPPEIVFRESETVPENIVRLAPPPIICSKKETEPPKALSAQQLLF